MERGCVKGGSGLGGGEDLFTVILYEDEGHGLVKKNYIHESYERIVTFIREVTM
ncbi:MAG: hypothetical protein WBA22_04050 [Candidatus Methanofastidiosia archaeon]